MPEDRAWLHKRIAERFINMLDCGFIAEVESLIEKWPLHAEFSSMRCVGYRQVLAYLQGAFDYSTMQEKGIAATRQLAKRQLTWLRKWPNAHLFASEDNNLLKIIKTIKR
jgi:tRNA dimethylallyltransferase